MRKDGLREEELWSDPAASAEAVGLLYVHDGQAGIRRRRCGRGFTYLSPKGETIRSSRTLERIHSLVIPPAWKQVWICVSPQGHLQATGRDARGRKQYLYHPVWREIRSQVKFAHIVQFAEALPALRRRVDADLRRRKVSRERVLAAVVRLLEKSLIRVGNEAYLRENNSFGLTTLRHDHVEVELEEIRFAFRGKSGTWQERSVRDRRIARVLRQMLDLPGQELFRYIDEEGELCTVASEDVNVYLREAAGDDFTAKDIRTWHATVCAAASLRSAGPAETLREKKKNVTRAVKEVAGLLGNRPAAARAYYIHPAIFESYLDDSLLSALEAILPQVDGSCPPELGALERAVKIFLEWRQERSPAH